MRKQLAKAVREQFAESLRKEFPQFRKTKNGSGYHIYKWKVGPRLSVFVALNTASRQDWFTVEIGWNNTDEFPGMAFNMSPKEMPKSGGLRMPLSGFWKDEDTGWEVAPEISDDQWDAWELEGKIPEEMPIEKAVKRVKPQVADAMAQFRKYAVPYFGKIAKKFGRTL